VDLSLFKRIIQTVPRKILYLRYQYRMHPEILAFPNNHFYGNSLRSRVDTTRQILKPYALINLDSTQNSTQNEVEFTLKLVEQLILKVPKNYSFGTITPNARQKTELMVKLSSKGLRQRINISVVTIDAAQGLEKDVIIISTARTMNGLGFLKHPQRLNVALTRAKKALYICGNLTLMNQSQMGRYLMDDAVGRGCYLDLDQFQDDQALMNTLAPN
jgi:senataxin